MVGGGGSYMYDVMVMVATGLCVGVVGGGGTCMM